MNSSRMIGNVPPVLNFNRWLFLNSTGSSVTNCRFSLIVGMDLIKFRFAYWEVESPE